MAKKIKGEISRDKLIEEKYPGLFEALQNEYLKKGRSIPQTLIELTKIIIKL